MSTSHKLKIGDRVVLVDADGDWSCVTAKSAARSTRPNIVAINATACTATTAGRLATMTFRLITAKRVGT